MNSQEYIRNIAIHYPDTDSINRVLDYAGVDTINLDLDGKPLNTWFFALKEVARQNKVAELVRIVSAEYPALIINESDQAELHSFLLKRKHVIHSSQNGSEKKKLVFYSVGLIIILIFGYYFIFKKKVEATPGNIIVVLHKRGDRNIRPVSNIGTLKISEESHQRSIEEPISKNGIVSIGGSHEWMSAGQLRMTLIGLDNDSITYSVRSDHYALSVTDTNWIDISTVPKSGYQPLSPVDFVSIRYKDQPFDFLANRSILQLKKYILVSKEDVDAIFANRSKLFYMGDELENESMVSAVHWVQNRNVQMEVVRGMMASSRNVEVFIFGKRLTGALIFINDEPGRIGEGNSGKTHIIIPKLIGDHKLEIYHRDIHTTIPVKIEYSTSNISVPAEEFDKYSRKIRKVLK